MRIIARLDVKNEFVIKGIHLEGLRKVGEPNALARAYYAAGIDELIFIDAVASLYDRNNLFPVIRAAARDIFVPITVGGGLRSLDDVSQALDAGADKVAVNTAALRRPELISDIAGRYGSQCVVASVQAKRMGAGWVAYAEAGREPAGRDVLEWAAELEARGAGELLVTSVDQEGTRSGFDVPLATALNARLSIPLIVSGGYGQPQHLDALLAATTPSAACFAAVLHYGAATPETLREVSARGLERTCRTS